MKCFPLAEASGHLWSIVEQASTTHERFEITRSGSRAAVLLGADDYDAVMETLAILSDTNLVKDIGKGLRDLTQGDTYSLKQVAADMPTDP